MFVSNRSFNALSSASRCFGDNSFFISIAFVACRNNSIELLEKDDAICIRPQIVVSDTPTICRFGKFLVVDENQLHFKSSGNAGGNHCIFKLSFPVLNFTNFKSNPAAQTNNTKNFCQRGVHALLEVNPAPTMSTPSQIQNEAQRLIDVGSTEEIRKLASLTKDLAKFVESQQTPAGNSVKSMIADIGAAEKKK